MRAIAALGEQMMEASVRRFFERYESFFNRSFGGDIHVDESQRRMLPTSPQRDSTLPRPPRTGKRSIQDSSQRRGHLHVTDGGPQRYIFSAALTSHSNLRHGQPLVADWQNVSVLT